MTSPHDEPPPQTEPRELERAAELLHGAEALLIAAGAGMGVDSGLPDFRGRDGFWRTYPALGRARRSFEDAASPAFFASDPALAWGFYGHRLSLYRQTTPHPGFEILRQWGQSKPRGLFVNTSNVDGQFQKAGFDRDAICEIHGSIHHLQCNRGCREDTWAADDFAPRIDDETGSLINPAPVCPRCGALARPNILMFDDWAWVDRRTAMQRLRRDQWLADAGRLVVIEVGAGVHLPTIRRFTETLCRTRGAQAIRINPRQPEISPKLGVGLRLGGLDGITALSALVHPAWGPGGPV